MLMRDKSFQFLYRDDTDLHLLDPKTLEQICMPLSLKASDAVVSLLESGTEVKVRYCEDTPVSIIPPKNVKCTVKSVNFVHDSGDSRKFTVITEAGGRVVVPLKVEPGDQIIVNTEDFTYHSRP
jgi:elongation factor P